ncbi:hypothetical protein D3C72_2232420 [compost metagenome]
MTWIAIAGVESAPNSASGVNERKARVVFKFMVAPSLVYFIVGNTHPGHGKSAVWMKGVGPTRTKAANSVQVRAGRVSRRWPAGSGCSYAEPTPGTSSPRLGGA